jgi:death on curing protein
VRVYLTLVEVLDIHDDLIARYGGSSGIRDPGLLEAALFRPQTGHYADIVEEAAALWESLAQNHPFIDGNKRVAFAVTYTFLAVNGVTIYADADKTFDFIKARYDTGTFRFGDLLGWLRENVSAGRD